MGYTAADLSLIVRYDGTLTAFKQLSATDKAKYDGRVVFIRGAKTGTGTNVKYTDQGIYVHGVTSNGNSSGEYLSLSNIEEISSSLKYFKSIKVGDETFDAAGGGSTLVLTTADADLEITVDETGVHFDASAIKTTLIGNTANNSNLATHPNTITGAKAYTDALKGTARDGQGSGDVVPTVYGAINYATKKAAAAKSEAKSEITGNAETDTKDSKTIEGTRKYVDDKVTEINKTNEGIIDRVEDLEEAMPKKADLDASGKIQVSQLPDAILGQLTFGGVTLPPNVNGTIRVAPSDSFKTIYPEYVGNKADISIPKTDASKIEGVYFIVGPGDTDQFDLDATVGDWIVSTGLAFYKIDNSDSVTSVANLTGAITASKLAEELAKTGDVNELALKSEVDAKYTKPAGGIPTNDLHTDVKSALTKAGTAIQAVESSNETLVSITKKAGTATPTIVVAPQAKSIDSLTATTDGLATTSDVRAFLAAVLTVRVVS